ncbi:MAG: hypothetical protein RLZ98_2536 [Pseudomonadota bacterium]|jgi:chaperone required for assembly of F1-ATPase
MSDPKSTPNFVRKRFYSDVGVEQTAEGFALKLDGRAVRTPAKAALVLPTKPLAEAVADEWRAQSEFVNPATMPLTRLANSTIDGVVARLDEVRSDAARYAGSDLLCYRAEGPAALVELQAEAWDPVIASVEARIGARFIVTSGIMPATQPAETLEKVAAWFRAGDAFAIAPLHVITTISGSCILAIAHAEGLIDIETLWRHALVDEDYQMRLWGRDDEALRVREQRWGELEAAARFMALSRVSRE